MKTLQIAFVALLGVTCIATYATSETLHPPCEMTEQDSGPAPSDT